MTAVPVARLITIPISHFCEKARWALDRAGVPYREERHLQVIHRFVARRAGGGRTVPVLVTAGGVLAESSEILAFADRAAPAGRRLYPDDPAERGEVARLEGELDTVLGPEGRRWMYFHMLERADLARAYNCTGVPAWERRAFPLLFPLAARYIAHDLEIDAASAASSQRAVERSFDGIAARLSDGRRYLFGDSLGAADIAFAALAAAVLLPDSYGVPLPRVEELPAAMATGVRAFRDHPAGQFACRLYREDRG